MTVFRMTIDRYGVYWVNLDPTVGSEPAKNRPAVVVSDEDMNTYLQTVVVCPMTSRIHAHWPSRVQTNAAGKRSEVVVDQIRTISRSRIREKIGELTAPEAAEVRHVITLMYGVLSVSARRDSQTAAGESSQVRGGTVRREPT